MSNTAFTEAQKQYLQGFVSGADLQRHNKGLSSLAGSLPILNNGGAASGGGGEMVTVGGPDAIHRAAQDRFIAAGKKLNNEEKAKREKNALDIYDEMVERAKKGNSPRDQMSFSPSSMACSLSHLRKTHLCVACDFQVAYSRVTNFVGSSKSP